MRMPCQVAVLNNTIYVPRGELLPFRRRKSSLFNYITQNSEALLSARFPLLLFIADCRIMSKNDRLPVLLFRLSRTPKVMPTLGWKPEANDVIIPCATTSNLLGCSLILNISQINGPNRCRKKYSKSFMLRQPFPPRIYGSSSSIPSQERR